MFYDIMFYNYFVDECVSDIAKIFNVLINFLGFDDNIYSIKLFN